MSARILAPTVALAALAAAAAWFGPQPAPLEPAPVEDTTPVIRPITRDDAPPGFPDVAGWTAIEHGVRIHDVTLGDGATVEPGSRAVFDLQSWTTDGAPIQSTWTAPRPIVAEIGRGQVIRGVEAALVGMKVGGRRAVSLPASEAYRDHGGPGIPPNTDLVAILAVRAIARAKTSPSAPPPIAAAALRPLEEGVQIVDLEPGRGAVAEAGMTASVHLSLWSSSGELLESSAARGQPVLIRLGERRILPAIEAVVVGMAIGQRRAAVIQPDRLTDATGETRLPTDGPLTVEVELLSVEMEPAP